MNVQYAQCKGEENELQRRLCTIVPHAFGDHKTCQDSWCKYFQDSENFQHQYLPNGEDLTDSLLCVDLTKLFESYVANAKKLSKLPNE